MKRKKVALYSPYLATLGGGEKHVLSILQVLEEEGYDPYIFWEDCENEIKQKFSISFQKLSFLPPLFREHSFIMTKLKELHQFDIFLYVTDGSYFFSTAKNNYVFCMVPNPHLFAKTAINWLKTTNYSFIANSFFTKSWLSRWNISATVLYPYISQEFIELSKEHLTKENIVLVTGRFFEHLHSKRQDKAIEAFTLLQKKGHLNGFKLILAGSVQESDQEYANKIIELAKNNSNIEVELNCSFTELISLYKKSRYYWHFTGYGIDDTIEPEKVEHLGITPLEAMAAGCVPFCYNGGGLKELVKSGENGYLFSSIDELENQIATISDAKEQEIIVKAQHFVGSKFTYDHFKKDVIQLFT